MSELLVSLSNNHQSWTHRALFRVIDSFDYPQWSIADLVSKVHSVPQRALAFDAVDEHTTYHHGSVWSRPFRIVLGI